MTDDEESKIKVYIDGKEQTIKSIDRKERNDVIKAIPGYGGSVKNPKPGYTIKLENTNFNNGKHILRVDVVSRENKTISTFSTIINYENYKAQMYIDNPAEDKVVKIDKLQNPKPSYTIGFDAKITEIFSHLPQGFINFVIKKKLDNMK